MSDINSLRNWTEDYSHENGNYQNKCCFCSELFMGHKRRPFCKKCAVRKHVISLFHPPFKADFSGQYVFDSQNQMVTDVRSWGMMQYQEDADILHDELCRMIADALNDFWKKDLKKDFIQISKEILSDFDEQNVLMKTPICYHRKFERLRELLNLINS